MADDTAQTPPPAGVSGAAPLYSKPEALNFNDHGNLGLKTSTRPFAFAANQHYVPVVASEFAAAATSYPVIFAGEERVPLAIMGLRPGETLYFADLEGMPDVYVPGYVRRYPFTVASQEDTDNLVICIDRGSELLTEDAEVKLFKDGDLSEYGKASVAFCESYERDRMATEEMVKLLKELDLFDSHDIGHTPPGEEVRQTVATFFAISEDRLNALPIEQFERLRPLLGAIYAHLVSLFNWERLFNRSHALREAKSAAGATGKPN
jgi:hypothetical protein